MKETSAMKRNYQYFLKDSVRKTIDFSTTEQNGELNHLPHTKALPSRQQNHQPCPPMEMEIDRGVSILSGVLQ
jgi:hypothetical protein